MAERRRGRRTAQSIAFDLRTDDRRADIYVIPARGGEPVRVTTDAADDYVPSWSRDGLWIYFGSTRSGRNEIWKVAPGGGEPVQVTQHGGLYAKESVDGRDLYYASTATFPATICRVPVAGGEEVTVVRNLAYYANYSRRARWHLLRVLRSRRIRGKPRDVHTVLAPGRDDRVSELRDRQSQPCADTRSARRARLQRVA